jgi:hypothetical protein
LLAVTAFPFDPQVGNRHADATKPIGPVSTIRIFRGAMVAAPDSPSA